MEQLMEYFGVATGLLYLGLEIRQHRAMWVVGFLTSLVYVFVFFRAKIYADMGLNCYYVAISVYGFWQWSRTWKRAALHREAGEFSATAGCPDKPRRREQKQQESCAKANPPILYRRLNLRLGIGLAVALGAIYGGIYYFLVAFTDSPIPAGDAFTTAVGIVATWMLARRIIEHWICWVVVNGVSVYLYELRGLYPTMFLYFCYTVLAVIGFYTWKKKGIQTNDRTL